MIAEYRKPLPAPDPETQPFWDSCKAHELRAQRCAACLRYRWPPQGICPHCYSWDSTWENLSGTGRVYSYVVVHHEPGPFANDVPYIVANITIDGTDDLVRILSNVEGVQWEEITVGMAVRVFFQDVTTEITLPKFRPA